ncbi:MAG: 50S ribosomal protein L4 [Clostridiales bacterium]|jgi:large subunit ribosomal protein L4|nr:50S ribosomal protein L4 [Clostridiales bacterium]
MTKVNLINIKGEKVKDLNLKDTVWNIEVNDIVLKKAIDLQLASLRQGTHKTKDRSEVRGGGAKPWRQKGTGRARHGSRRSPIWVGGGVVFGVTPRSYTFKMNKKERVLALKSALTYKYKEKKLVVIDDITINSVKTKEVKILISELKLEGKILFVTSTDAEKLYLATRNLSNITVILSNEINVFDIVNADVIVCDEETINTIEEVLK